MKNLLFSIITFTVFGLLYSFTLPSKSNTLIDLSGKWKLEIDETIDGLIKGSNGCSYLQISPKGINNFVATYEDCKPSSNAKGSHFSGQIYVSNRGNLINMVQDNLSATQYYSAWSGKLLENGEIIGIWTDVEGNQGEFKLSQQ